MSKPLISIIHYYSSSSNMRATATCLSSAFRMLKVPMACDICKHSAVILCFCISVCCKLDHSGGRLEVPRNKYSKLGLCRANKSGNPSNDPLQRKQPCGKATMGPAKCTIPESLPSSSSCFLIVLLTSNPVGAYPFWTCENDWSIVCCFSYLPGELFLVSIHESLVNHKSNRVLVRSIPQNSAQFVALDAEQTIES